MVELLILFGLFGAVLGAVLASFGCVVSERRAAGLSIMGRSKCACGRQLTVLENIPIVGWLRARGQSSCCGVKLPARYLVAELASAAGGGVVGVVCGLLAYGGTVAGPVIGVVAVAGFAVLLVCVVVGTKPGRA